jgi:hypothetical protein
MNDPLFYHRLAAGVDMQYAAVREPTRYLGPVRKLPNQLLIEFNVGLQPHSLLGLAAGKSSCARALSLLSFCPSIRLSRETGLTTRHLSQCSLHGRIEGAEKP